MCVICDGYCHYCKENNCAMSWHSSANKNKNEEQKEKEEEKGE